MTRTALPARACLVLSALLFAACAAPPSTVSTDAATTAPVQAEPVAQPPPMAGPLPADRVGRPGSGATVVVDRSCSTSADCAVRDVGSCCGYFPACINKDSPTDPKAVQAQCQAQGRMGVCGFREVSACQCVEGVCRELRQDILPADG